MTQTGYAAALQLLDAGDVEATALMLDHALQAAPHDPGLLYVRGRLLFMLERYAEAAEALAAASKADPGNVDVALAWAIALRSKGTVAAQAAARDRLLELLERFPGDLRVIQATAESCAGLGPEEKAAELWQRVAASGSEAAVHFALSESLAVLGRRDDALDALRTAARLDPEQFGEALSAAEAGAAHRPREIHADTKYARYSYPTDLDLKATVARDLLLDFNAPKFVNGKTSFFTIGSCFAWTITRTLAGMGYQATCMPLSEDFYTTFAARSLIEWLDGTITDPELSKRIAKLLAPGFSKQSVISSLKETDVFILTLGVAAAFFDKTGTFVMPRQSALQKLTLAQEHTFRTTSVQENVTNTERIVEFVLQANPRAQIVLMVSPVPLYATFEFSSPLIADCISKSTMRLVAHEIEQRYQHTHRVHYFPSFELFRWLGSHTASRLYGTDDGAAFHPSEDAIKLMVEAFVEKCRDPDRPAPGARNAAEALDIPVVPLFSPGMIDPNAPAYFYGSGRMGQGLLAAMERRAPWNFKGFIDSRLSGSCRGFPVLDLGQFRAAYAAGDQVVITSGSVREIAGALAGLGVSSAMDANPWWRARAFPVPR